MKERKFNMLSAKKIQEIRNHLEKAQNPIFFFDNDQDGLCSFLLLQRAFERGKGVPIKSFPDLSESYFRRVEELNGDYIFILDKPVVSDAFLERVREKNIPLVWIDHHDVKIQNLDFINYYNPLNEEKKSNEPVTAICFEIAGKKEDAWLAIIGCIADGFLPYFYESFAKDYPELCYKSDKPFDFLYKSRIGEMVRILGAGLKDTTSNVVAMIKFLLKAKNPYDILEENLKNKSFHKRFKEIESKYKIILEKALILAKKSDKLIFFKYSGDLSISGELSNELYYRSPGKFVVVAYARGNKANLSLRGDNIREIFSQAIDGFENATGGGHRDAVGGQIQEKDLDEFNRRLESFIEKR